MAQHLLVVQIQQKILSQHNWTWDAFTHCTNICKLEFNAAKCKTLHLGKKNCTLSTCKAISISHMERNLGVLVDNKLNFHIYAQATITRANQTLGLIKRMFNSRSPTINTKLYKSLL